jgi:hypothetical protein
MKDTVQRALELDILHLQRNGFLSLAADFSWQIEWTRNGEPCSSIGYVLAKHGARPVSMRLLYATANSTTNGDSGACDYWVRSLPQPATSAASDFGSSVLAGRMASHAGAVAGNCIYPRGDMFLRVECVTSLPTKVHRNRVAFSMS